MFQLLFFIEKINSRKYINVKQVIELLGISIYLSQTIEQQKAYIKMMREHGFTSIFTSLHIPEDDHSNYGDQLKKLANLAKELDMELMADISPDSLKTLGYNWKNAEGLRDIGLTGLRIDYGVDEQTIIDLSKKMKIAINASTIPFDSLKRMKKNGLVVESVEAWHNFYPRPETGLGLTHFIEQNKKLKAEGITVMAFIPGDESLRGPLFMKLPTLEKHRHESPFAAFLEMRHDAFVDKILIGDHSIRSESLAQFKDYKQGVITLRAIPSRHISQSVDKVAGIHTNRADFARDCIRSVESRHYAAIGEDGLQPENCVERLVGSITIDNTKYLRYQGEIQITVNDLPADEKVNVLGRVIDADRPLLNRIKGNKRFKIEWI